MADAFCRHPTIDHWRRLVARILLAEREPVQPTVGCRTKVDHTRIEFGNHVDRAVGRLWVGVDGCEYGGLLCVYRRGPAHARQIALGRKAAWCPAAERI